MRMACCFLQDYSSTCAKTDRPLFAQLSRPTVAASLFDAWPGPEWQSRNLRLAPGRPPNVVRPLGRERSLRPSSSLHFVRRCAGYALLHSRSQRLAALLMLVMGYFIKLAFYAVNNPRSGLRSPPWRLHALATNASYSKMNVNRMQVRTYLARS